MKLKSLIILVIAVAIGVAAYYLSTSDNKLSTDANKRLVPDLAENLNSINKFIINEAGNALLTSVSKTDQGWVVDNRDGYQANIALVRDTFNNLAEAKLIEAKTSNPENFVKLGVEDLAAEKAQGVLLTLEGLQSPVNVIFGKDGSSGKNTQFVRRKDEQQSWLINKKIKLDRDVTDWLQKDLLDIPPEQIKVVQIKHPDGSEVTIKNDGLEEYEFTLDADVPDGKKISESEVYQLANAMSSLQLRDVASFSKLNVESMTPVITTFKTFDGLTIVAKSYPLDLETYFTVEVAFSKQDVDEDSSNPLIISNPEAAEKLAKVSTAKLNGWAYIFPTITQSALIKTLDSFFIEQEGE
jgi:hypothetical protein